MMKRKKTIRILGIWLAVLMMILAVVPGLAEETPAETAAEATAETAETTAETAAEATTETTAETTAETADEAAAETTAEAAETAEAAAEPAVWRMVQNVVFQVPVPQDLAETDRGEEKSNNGQLNWIKYASADGDRSVYLEVTSYKKNFSMKADEIRGLYESKAEELGDKLLWQEEILLDGQNPASVMAAAETVEEDGQQIQETLIRVLYFRCCSLLEMHYTIRVNAEEEVNPDYAEYLPAVLQISYNVPEDRAGLPEWLVTPECFVTTLVPDNGAMAVASGKTLKIKAVMQGEKLVKAMNPSAAKQIWLVLEVSPWLRGEWVPADKKVATVTQSGQIRAGTVEEVTPVVVAAYNSAVGYTASQFIMILPKQTKFALSETAATLYAGESAPLQLTVSAEPNGTLLFTKDYSNISWKLDKEALASLEVAANGLSAAVTPLQAGTVTLTVKDTVSGKTAKCVIKINEPVTAVEISGPETIAAGKSATFKAVLTPEKPTSKKVTWSIDQEKDIATIDANGKLTVKKDAPSGTVITVTCRAEGSSLERTAQAQVTVE